MNENKLKQILSTSLSLALAVTSAPMPAGAAGPVSAAPAFVSRLVPQEKFGYVASSFSPDKDAKAPRLILISDLHAHVEVQHNIVGMLHDIVGKLNPAAGRKVPIFVEGGYEKNLEEPLKKISDSKVRAFLAEYLMQKSQIGAAQGFSEEIAGSGKVTLIGVENRAEYEANRTRYARTYPVRARLLRALQREELAVRQLMNYVSNGSFKKMQSMREDYFAGRVSQDQFVKALVRQAQRYNVHIRAVETLKNAPQASVNAVDAAMALVYGAVTEKMSAGAPWTAFLRKSLGDEQTIRQNIARFESDFDLLKRLVANQLTPAEVPLAVARMPYLTRMAESLVANSEIGISVKAVVEQSVDFYPLAILRDKSLVVNSLKSLDAMGDREATGVLIVGGFHADAISQYLRDHGISYLHLNPTITRDLTTSEQINYVRRMGLDLVKADELQADLKALTGAGKRAVSASAVGAINGTSTPNEGENGPQAMGAFHLVPAVPAAENAVVALNALRDGGLEQLADPTVQAQGVVSAGSLQVAAASLAAEKNVTGAARLSNLAARIDAAVAEDEFFRPLTQLKVYENQSYTLVRGADGTYAMADGQTANAGQQAMIEEVNKTRALDPDAPKFYDVFLTPNDEDLNMRSQAITFRPKGADRAAVVMTQSVHEDLASTDQAKKDNARVVVAHETTHATSTSGRSEGYTMQAGLLQALHAAAAEAYQEAIAQGAETAVAKAAAVAAIQRVLGNTAGQWKLYADDQHLAAFANVILTNDAFRNDLAVAIANQLGGVIRGPMNEAQMQAVIKILKEKYQGQVPDYLIESTAHRVLGGVAFRMGDKTKQGAGDQDPNIDPNAPKPDPTVASGAQEVANEMAPTVKAIETEDLSA